MQPIRSLSRLAPATTQVPSIGCAVSQTQSNPATPLVAVMRTGVVSLPGYLCAKRSRLMGLGRERWLMVRRQFDIGYQGEVTKETKV